MRSMRVSACKSCGVRLRCCRVACLRIDSLSVPHTTGMRKTHIFPWFVLPMWLLLCMLLTAVVCPSQDVAAAEASTHEAVVWREVAVPIEAPAVVGEATILLTAQGRHYRQRVTVSAPAALYAATHGGWHTCFADIAAAGASLRQICNWAAYPLGEGLTAWLDTVETPPIDATVRPGITAPVVVPHRDGHTFGVTHLLEAVADCLCGRQAMPLVLRHTPAVVTTEMARARTRLLATFATPYAHQSNRVHNLSLACHALNGCVVSAGESFSFNTVVGLRTAERGYLPAKIIADGQFTEGVGGGVCQVSTTLYNAAMAAGMTQLEVHQHSLAVHYTQPSRDAMVSGWSDLRFRNDAPYPIYIYADAHDGRVQVRLYGMPTAGQVRLQVDSTVVEPQCDVDEQGNRLHSTQGYVLVTAGADGIRSRLLRIVDGHSEVLRRNVYPRRDAVWRRMESQKEE